MLTKFIIILTLTLSYPATSTDVCVVSPPKAPATNLAALSASTVATPQTYRFEQSNLDQEAAETLGLQRSHKIHANRNIEVAQKISDLKSRLSNRKMTPEDVADQIYNLKENYQEILEPKTAAALDQLANNLLVKDALAAKVTKKVSDLALQLKGGRTTHAIVADTLFSLKVKYKEWTRPEVNAQLDELAKDPWIASAIFTKVANAIGSIKSLCDQGALTPEAAVDQFCFITTYRHSFDAQTITILDQLEADPRLKTALITKKVKEFKQLWDKKEILSPDALNWIEHFKTTYKGSFALETRRLLNQLEQDPRIIEEKQEQESQRKQEERKNLKKEWKKVKKGREINDYKNPLYHCSGGLEALIDAYYLTRLEDYQEAVHNLRFVERAWGRSSKIFEHSYYQNILDYLIADDDFQNAYALRMKEEWRDFILGGAIICVCLGAWVFVNLYLFGADSSEPTSYDWGNTSSVNNISTIFEPGGVLQELVHGNLTSSVFSPSSITPPPALTHMAQGNMATEIAMTSSALVPVLAPGAALAKLMLGNITNFTQMLLNVLKEPKCLSVSAVSLLSALHQFDIRSPLPNALCIFFKVGKESFDGSCLPSNMQDYPIGANGTCDMGQFPETTAIRKDLILIQLGPKDWKSVIPYPFNPTETAELSLSEAALTVTHSGALTPDDSRSFSDTHAKPASNKRRRTASDTHEETASNKRNRTGSETHEETVSATQDKTASAVSGTRDDSATATSNSISDSPSLPRSLSQTLASPCDLYNQYLLKNATAYEFLKTTSCYAIYLMLGNKLIGDAEVIALAPAIQQLTKLTLLGLLLNNIGDTGATALASILPQLTQLSTLMLNFNKIGDVGATALAQTLQILTQLSVLTLNNNNIGDAGAMALAPTLQQLTQLTALALQNNNIGDVGATALAVALQNLPLLETLDLSGNNINATTQAKIRPLLSNVTTLRF